MRRANMKLKYHDLTLTQSGVLDFIVDSGGEVTQKNVEDFMEINHSAVVGIITRLERKGLITSGYYSGDKRQKVLTITSEGRKVHDDINADKWNVERSLTKGFTQYEYEELFRLLYRVYRNLEG